MAHKKSAPKHLQHLLQISMMLMIVLSVGFYGMQLLTSHAATGSYYTCNSGDTLSGSICTHKSTYNATAATSYTCGTVTSASPTCYSQTAATDIGAYTCASPAGQTFPDQLEDTVWCAKYAGQVSGGRCPAGTTGGWAGTCWLHHAYLAYHTPQYTCNGSPSPNNSPICYSSYTATKVTKYSCNNGDALSNTICTATSTYAATFHAATTTVSSTTKKTTSTKSTNTPVTLSPSQPPSAPADFKAEVLSSKVVELTWTAGQAAAGVKDYVLERSVDNNTWETVATISDTSYTDTTTDFATKYYYRLHETDNNGANSDYATTDVTTGKFSSTGSTVRSDDKVVTISIPSGSFDRDVSCSITSSQGGLPTVPTKLLLVGPYDILCVADDGSIIGSFKKPLSVTMGLSGVSSGYGAVTAKLFDDSSENDAKSTYDAKTHKISFELTSDKSFAIYGKKQGGVGKEIFTILLLLVAGGGGAFYLRRYWAGRQTSAPAVAVPSIAAPTMMPTATVVSGATPPPAANAENIFEQAVNKPNCTHLSMAHQVQPQSSGCAECTAEHKHWKGLRICLTCGHVGCSDDSDEQHARKHYEQTGHPLIYEYGNPGGDSIGWCYIDQTYI